MVEDMEQVTIESSEVQMLRRPVETGADGASCLLVRSRRTHEHDIVCLRPKRLNGSDCPLTCRPTPSRHKRTNDAESSSLDAVVMTSPFIANRGLSHQSSWLKPPSMT